MFIIQKIDGAYGAYRYVAANYETTLSYKDALVFEIEDSAKKYLSSLQKGCTFYNNYRVHAVGHVPQTPAPAAEQIQLDMFATPPAKTKTTTPKTRNPI